MGHAVSNLPVEVELALDVMPCQAMRRAYDGADGPHPCAHFAEWGVLHSYDYARSGPPPEDGILQPSVYAGKRPVVPEILSGCRKAPILAVGINPNLPGWPDGTRNAIHPYFDDYLQYAHYFRWRALDKLRIPKTEYEALRAGRRDDPEVGTPLVRPGQPIAVERAPVTMYLQYQRLLDGLAEAQGWQDHALAVGEDLAYANMVACGGSRWTVRATDDMPVMGPVRERRIIDECFNKRAHFPRQLLQSLPAVVIVFSDTTGDAFITRLARHFTKGKPIVGEGWASLLDREIRLELGRTDEGAVLDTRVIFSPHASARQDDFDEARAKIVAHLSEEVDRGALALNPASGHLARRIGGCQFCTNTLYSIGKCDYADELRPLAAGVDPLASEDSAGAAQAERQAQLGLLARFMSAPRAADDDALETLDAAAPFAPKMVLRGKVATMAAIGVIDDAKVYCASGSIVAVLPATTAPPAGFETIAVVETGGVIFPGLADLHNHLAYNILSLWSPGRALKNRSQWLSNSDYKSKVGLVMDVVAKRQDLIKAVIRYVEAKLLIGGVTSGQGMNTKYGGRALFRGIIRNFEQPGDPALTAIRHKITDIQPLKIAEVRAAIETGAPYFLHLAEGTNDSAQAQYGLLESNGLVQSNVVGIHSLGLTPADLLAMGAAGASVVWSPFSNSILYGRTLDVGALLDSGSRFALGSDWTPSGSRNILGEIKVAALTAQAQNRPLTAEALSRAVTADAMRIAGWGDRLGAVEAGKYADLTVVADRPGLSAHDSLLHATEADVRLVVIAGHARYGEADVMRRAAPGGTVFEPLKVGGREKALNLNHPESPLNSLSLAQATKMLEAALADLPAARDAAAFEPLDDGPTLELELEINELADEMADDFDVLAAAVLPQSVPLDPLTVIDDPDYWRKIDEMTHLPDFLRSPTGLRKFYS